MGKKSKTKTGINMDYPFVSICTPTFNRRPFIPYIIKCFEQQTYPKEHIEWIIVDDGTDPIGDLVSHIPQVKYYYNEDKMVLGKKRNYMHTKCSGSIIIYMDDDDYYPPERIAHVVEKFKENPKMLLAGSSEMHMYFSNRGEMYQCGPYRENHATAATFAFRKELLSQTRYDESQALSEEQKFTKHYSIPMIQLDTQKTILVFSHSHNSLNKEKLLENPEMSKIVPSRFTVDDFIHDPELKQFYMHDMPVLLDQYDAGAPKHKKELIKQLKKKETERNEFIKNANEKAEGQQKLINLYTSQNMVLQLQQQIVILQQQLDEKNRLIRELIGRLQSQTQSLSSK